MESLTVSDHYTRSGIIERVLAALAADGKDVRALTPEDLAPVDQFHIEGKEAALRLARNAGLAPGMEVLDAGGGIGGPARLLAREFGCRVTVLDLTEDFCRAGEELTRLVGLSDQVKFQHGNALAMPFADASFDLVWTEHSTMNIEDKETLYKEIHRVLRPQGRLAFHEIMAGPNQPIHFPVPWARDPAISSLRPPDEIRSILQGLGFHELSWQDESQGALAWAEQRIAAARDPYTPPPAAGLHLILGEDFGPMFANVIRNLREGRLAVIQAVLE